MYILRRHIYTYIGTVNGKQLQSEFINNPTTIDSTTVIQLCANEAACSR